MKKNKGRYAVTLVILMVVYILSSVFLFPKKNYKNYVIEHKEQIKIFVEGSYYLENIEDSYYTDITLNILSDSSYYFVLWGDRKSILWRFRKDKIVNVDIPYNRFKGLSVKDDIELLNCLKNK